MWKLRLSTKLSDQKLGEVTDFYAEKVLNLFSFPSRYGILRKTKSSKTILWNDNDIVFTVKQPEDITHKTP